MTNLTLTWGGGLSFGDEGIHCDWDCDWVHCKCKPCRFQSFKELSCSIATSHVEFGDILFFIIIIIMNCLILVRKRLLK